MIVVTIPLMVTSFKTIRGNTRGGDWKKLQRLAYVFFGLIYVHVMVPLSKRSGWILCVHVIFGVYLVLLAANQKVARKPVCRCRRDVVRADVHVKNKKRPSFALGLSRAAIRRGGLRRLRMRFFHFFG